MSIKNGNKRSRVNTLSTDPTPAPDDPKVELRAFRNDPDWINVTLLVDRGRTAHGTATASYVQLEDHELGHFWYFNRIVVDPISARGHGYGSMMLKLVLQEVQYSRHQVQLYCEMNPYEGASRLEDLRRFYLRHGFVQHPERDHVVIWTPKTMQELTAEEIRLELLHYNPYGGYTRREIERGRPGYEKALHRYRSL